MQTELDAINDAFRTCSRPARCFDCTCLECLDYERALDNVLESEFNPDAISGQIWDWLSMINDAGYLHAVPRIARDVIHRPENIGQFVGYIKEQRLNAMSAAQLRALLAFVRRMSEAHAAEIATNLDEELFQSRIELLERRLRALEE